jgi:thiol-disulfide isomerase/thioredoxin
MKIMSKTLFILLSISVLVNVAGAGKITDFTLKNLENKRTTYSEIKGEKLTILDFWATWCKPCTRAIPKLVSIYEDYKEKGVQVIGINVDSPRNLPKVKPFVRSKGITYPILLDSNNEVMNRLQITIMPTLLIISEDDEILFMHRGYRPGDELILREKIDELLTDKKAESEDE